MTPGVIAARRAGVPIVLHEYPPDPGADSYGLEAAEKLKVPPASVFKTLVAKLDGARLAVAVLPVHRTLDLKALADATGAKRAAMADPQEAERSTGYVLGGISPLGQRKRLPTVVDRSALDLERVLVSAGRRGLQIELAPADLIRLVGATTAPLAR
jgi:Cys-tRNA(Pro)/Cys-tRNA(Cys) deacylase